MGVLIGSVSILLVSCAMPGPARSVSSESKHPYLGLGKPRMFTLKQGSGGKVPEKCVWAVSGHFVTEAKVATSDVFIKGRASIGEYEIEGEYWLTFQKRQSQTLWIYGDTEVGLGDTRPELKIKEYSIMSETE